MQAYRRAELIGQHTAGMVYLKSIFDLKDGASLELTVAKGYLFDGNPISADGLKPDVALPDDANLLASAVRALEAAAPSSK
jgi:C-terminal processing protease CtpA/Prc